MHIVITTQVFRPEIHPTAVMVSELAQFLGARGHRVTVAAGYPHHPLGTDYEGYTSRQLRCHEEHSGASVIRHWHLVSKDRRIPARAAVMATQSVAIAAGAAGVARPDVLLNFGPPLLGPILGGAVSRARGAKNVSVVYDLYPDVVIDSGKLANPVAIALARRVERLSYRASDHIVVLSDGFRRELVGRGVPSEKISVIPVWLDPDEIRPLTRDNCWRREHGIPHDTKVVLYAGTIGLIAGAEIVLDAAQKLTDQNVLFLFVGEGQVRDVLQRDAEKRSLANVRFLPFQPRERLPEVQASADISLVTLAPGRARTSVPSKVVGYMAAGRPILASVDLDSDTAAAVGAAGGLVVEPGSSEALERGLRRLLASDRLDEIGSSARSYFERTYARDAALAVFERVLAGVLGTST